MRLIKLNKSQFKTFLRGQTTIWHILEKKECTDGLNNLKKGLSLVKIHLFTTSRNVKVDALMNINSEGLQQGVNIRQHSKYFL